MKRSMSTCEIRICWNCKDPATVRFLCVDCWRMALITAALIGGGGESVHQLLERFFSG